MALRDDQHTSWRDDDSWHQGDWRDDQWRDGQAAHHAPDDDVFVGRARVGDPRPPQSDDQLPPGWLGRNWRRLRPAHRGALRKRRLLLILSFLVMFSGTGMIAGSYFYDSVREPGDLTLVNSTEIFASDGATQLARLGSENRVEVPLGKLSLQVQKALIAGEDKNFYEHHGIDLSGIARAAWNNLTGGETQGGSTITQQYARQAAGDMEISYARKLREAIMARKLEDTHSKEQILGFYLNTVYFGRGAHGIGAAAEAYFAIPPDKIETLTVRQAAVLGAVLRQPEGKSGYDPANNLENAKGRWAYVLDNMIQMNWLTAKERDALTYPTPADPNNPQPGELQKVEHAKAGSAWGHNDRATGHIIKYVEAELDRLGILAQLSQLGLGDWKNAGLRIVTTIDPRAQAALEARLNRDVAGSAMAAQKENLIGAGVAIDPPTGRVLAYYGGNNKGTDTDWASDDEPHPPASSFKPYTLAAALAANISTQSIWDASEMHKGQNGAEADVANAGREIDSLPCGERCTLETLTLQSFNVAFYKVARKIGPDKVVTMAKQAGVKTMWGVNPFTPQHLDQAIPKGRTVFDYQVGFGQYPISVLDHASGMATLANHGMYQTPHFVLRVDRKNRDSGKWDRIPAGDEKIQGRQTIDRRVADEVTYVLKKIPAEQGHTLSGRQVASKSGTWENAKKKPDGVSNAFPGTNAHAWYVGYTDQIAAAIWVGSRDHNDTPIKDANGKNISGAGLPGQMWEDFMNQAHKDMKLPVHKLTDGSGGRLGDPNAGEFRADERFRFPRDFPTRPPRRRP
ncbi:penicillin-binding protein [Rhizocola hellebori]|uniref:Penicillin-binding protein n=1 Tax=Rhizocola hellebori TaxID=1392758 RepID=A0A8J3QID3_9ACTN|nr:transglycosylase domain-containing protein [Rhizocola hellebori]GIH10207.1 penicillin-binding protein [Rhizocola hellebori]